MAESILSIKNLSKSYGKRKVIENLSFEIQAGEIFGFLGPNGAGKSTTIRAILALIKPDQGDVEIFGKSVLKERNRALRGVGALIEQADFYKHLSALTNLKMLSRMEHLPESRIQKVLAITGLQDRQNDKVKAYSHGMKQRLGIAQALLSEPQLLILDEPTTGLDPRGMKEVRDLIRRLSSEGITILLSSHLLSEVEQICNSMAIINLGKLIITGKTDDLMNESKLSTTEIQAEPLKKTVKIITALGYGTQLTPDKKGIKIDAPRKELPEIVEKLVGENIKVSAVIPRTSLEEYFLGLTEGAA
jgi:ABC-2 type transport system ATP-binding protein